MTEFVLEMARITNSHFDEKQRYPRVTVISANPLRSDMPNGILMRSLFKGWPKDRLSQIYFPVGTTYLPEFDVCEEFRMIRTSGSVHRFQKHDEQAVGRVPVQTKAPSLSRRVMSRIKQSHGVMRWLKLVQEGWYAYSWVGRKLERELRDLQPEIVFANLGNFCLTKIICTACERLGIPIYLHVGDDYVTSMYQDIPCGSTIRSLSDHWFRRTVNYADGLETVSPLMSAEYGERYGREWNWFTVMVDPAGFDPTPRERRGPIRLVYAGGLQLERWKSLRQLALTLAKLRQEQGIKACLEIYSWPEQIETHRAALEVPGTTQLQGWIAPNELPQVLHDSDVLVHVESFDPIISAYTKLSFSTKLHDYMMAGRCILSFGPENLGSSRMVREAGAGITIGDLSSDGLESALLRVLEDHSQRIEHGANGRRWAMKWLEQKAGHERFRQAMVQALERRRQSERQGSVKIPA